MTAPWLQTRGSKKWDLLAPSAADVDWSDIAHALSNICRFTGHTVRFYSVAEHSYRVWETVSRMTPDPRAQLHALLHDAHEAFVGDMATPLQHALAASAAEVTRNPAAAAVVKDAIRRLKANTDAAIFEAAGLTAKDLAASEPHVKRADVGVLMRERDVILGPSPEPWDAKLEAHPVALVAVAGYAPRVARGLFLNALIPLLEEVLAQNVVAAGGVQ